MSSHFCYLINIIYKQEFSLLLPNGQRMNRGNADLKQLIKSCRATNVSDFIVIEEVRGEPGAF